MSKNKRKKSKTSRKHKPTQKSKLKKQQLEEEIKSEAARLEEEKKLVENAPKTITEDEQIDKALKVDSEEEFEGIDEEKSENVDLIEDEAAISRIINSIEEDEEKEKKEVNIKDNIQTQEKENEAENNTDCEVLQKKNKTLIAIIIVLVGIAVGSLFVDVAQLFSGKGFSARALQDAQVVEYDGSTWVRYDDPKIVVDVFTADDCEDCMTDEVLVRLRSLIPTLEAHYVNVRTQEGKEYAKKNGIKYIPSFVFSEGVINSDFYQGAAILFDEINKGKYYLESTKVGVPVGEYLEEPTDDNGINLGDAAAKNKIVIFTDLTCSNCQSVYEVANKLQENVEGVNIILKLAPDEELNKYAKKLVIAGQCADEQNKFDKFAVVAFENKEEINSSDDIAVTLTNLAKQSDLNKQEFEKCVSDKKIQQVIQNNTKEAVQFGISQLPAVFVNGQPHAGVITYENLKEQIESNIKSAEKNEQ